MKYGYHDVPDWAIEMVAALQRHEDEHPAGQGHPATQSCVWHILRQVPEEIRAYVDGYNTALRRTSQENDE